MKNEGTAWNLNIFLMFALKEWRDSDSRILFGSLFTSYSADGKTDFE
jgi:hypothetical protein